MRAGIAFARAASQPSVSGVRVFCIAADILDLNRRSSRIWRRWRDEITSGRFRWIQESRGERLPRQEFFPRARLLWIASQIARLRSHRLKHRPRSEIQLSKAKPPELQSI